MQLLVPPDDAVQLVKIAGKTFESEWNTNVLPGGIQVLLLARATEPRKVSAMVLVKKRPYGASFFCGRDPK